MKKFEKSVLRVLNDIEYRLHSVEYKVSGLEHDYRVYKNSIDDMRTMLKNKNDYGYYCPVSGTLSLPGHEAYYIITVSGIVWN